MKVKITKDEGFKPVTLELTLESVDQVRAMYAVMNHCAITNIVGEYGIDHGAIREVIKKDSGLNYTQLGDNTIWDRLNNSIKRNT